MILPGCNEERAKRGEDLHTYTLYFSWASSSLNLEALAKASAPVARDLQFSVLGLKFGLTPSEVYWPDFRYLILITSAQNEAQTVGLSLFAAYFVIEMQ